MKLVLRATFPAEGVMNGYTFMLESLAKGTNDIPPCCPGLSLDVIKESHFASSYIFTASAKYDIKLDVSSNTYPIISIVNKVTDAIYKISMEELLNVFEGNMFDIHMF